MKGLVPMAMAPWMCERVDGTVSGSGDCKEANLAEATANSLETAKILRRTLLFTLLFAPPHS